MIHITWNSHVIIVVVAAELALIGKGKIYD